MQKSTCCFFGHREIIKTENLQQKIFLAIEDLIVNKKVDTFLFGSKSQFNSLCYETVTMLKEHFPHIKRIYIRAEFPYIDENYSGYLLERYEDTYYPETLLNAGRSVYIQRNYYLIDNSKYCIVYFQESCLPKGRKSGTQLALHYAVKKEKHIIIFPQ